MGQEKLNIVEPAVIKAMGAYGGGVATTGGVCGTLLGGVALISSIYSRTNPDEKEHPHMWSLSKKFITQFEDLTRDCGSTNCRDIAGVDWNDRDEVKRYYSDPDSNRKRCIRLVGDAAYALGKILEDEG